MAKEEIPDSPEEFERQLEDKAENFEADDAALVPVEDGETEPQLGWAYETLEDLTKMTCRGYEDFVLLDAKGGLGKTYNIKNYLREELEDHEWFYQSGYTTPVELYKSLYQASTAEVIFLDDMAGITKNSKCVNMLKAATDTEGDENVVEWRSSQPPKFQDGTPYPSKFFFDTAIIMSFNGVPDNDSFGALESRGQTYEISFSYDERLELIEEVAKNDDLPLTYPERKEVVEWIRCISDTSMEPNIRTLVKTLNIKEYCMDEGKDWRKPALEVFNLDFEKYLIVQLRDDDSFESEMERVEEWMEKTGNSQGTYYNRRNELLEEGKIDAQ